MCHRRLLTLTVSALAILGCPLAPAAQDWGDAPDPPYPSLSVSNGAVHLDTSFEWLGPGVTDEPDSLQIDGDDDDGVRLLLPFVPGSTATMRVQVSVADADGGRYAGTSLFLNAWIDWNGDGTWSPVEQVADGVIIDPTSFPDGADTDLVDLDVFVPPGPMAGELWVRVRLDYGEDVGTPHGPAAFGEVEDLRTAELTVPGMFPDLQTAVDAAQPGDVIVLGPGTFPGGIIITTEGLTIAGAPPETKLQGGMPAALTFSGVESGAVVDLTLEQAATGVLIDGPPAAEGGGRLDPGTIISGFYIFRSNMQHNDDDGARVAGAVSSVIFDCLAFANGDSGIEHQFVGTQDSHEIASTRLDANDSGWKCVGQLDGSARVSDSPFDGNGTFGMRADLEGSGVLVYTNVHGTNNATQMGLKFDGDISVLGSLLEGGETGIELDSVTGQLTAKVANTTWNDTGRAAIQAFALSTLDVEASDWDTVDYGVRTGAGVTGSVRILGCSSANADYAVFLEATTGLYSVDGSNFMESSMVGITFKLFGFDDGTAGPVSITGCTVLDSGGDGIVIEDAGASTSVTITGNQIRGNANGVFAQESAVGIHGNIICANALDGVHLAGSLGSDVSGGNIFGDNEGFEVANHTPEDSPATGNDWGEVITAEMESGEENISEIFDCEDDDSVGCVDFSGWLEPSGLCDPECWMMFGVAALAVAFPGDPADVLLVEPIVPVTVTMDTVPVYPIPNDPTLSGLHVYAQVLLKNPLVFPEDPLQLSNGLDVEIGAAATPYGTGSGLTLWANVPPALGGALDLGFSVDGL